MLFSFKEINLIEDNRYRYSNATSIRYISKRDLNIINKLYKEYIGCEFPSFKIYSFKDKDVIISIDSNVETVKNDTLINLSKILSYQNDRRVFRLESDIHYLKTIVANGEFLFNCKD